MDTIPLHVNESSQALPFGMVKMSISPHESSDRLTRFSDCAENGGDNPGRRRDNRRRRSHQRVVQIAADSPIAVDPAISLGLRRLDLSAIITAAAGGVRRVFYTILAARFLVVAAAILFST